MVNGITLLGVSLTALGLYYQKPGGSAWFLLASATILVILGFIELFSKEKRK